MMEDVHAPRQRVLRRLRHPGHDDRGPPPGQQLKPIGIDWPFDTISFSRSMHFDTSTFGSFDTDSARVRFARACCSAVMTDCSAIRVWATWARSALTLLWCSRRSGPTGTITVQQTYLVAYLRSDLVGGTALMTGPRGRARSSSSLSMARRSYLVRTPRRGRAFRSRSPGCRGRSWKSRVVTEQRVGRAAPRYASGSRCRRTRWPGVRCAW